MSTSKQVSTFSDWRHLLLYPGLPASSGWLQTGRMPLSDHFNFIWPFLQSEKLQIHNRNSYNMFAAEAEEENAMMINKVNSAKRTQKTIFLLMTTWVMSILLACRWSQRWSKKRLPLNFVWNKLAVVVLWHWSMSPGRHRDTQASRPPDHRHARYTRIWNNMSAFLRALVNEENVGKNIWALVIS